MLTSNKTSTYILLMGLFLFSIWKKMSETKIKQRSSGNPKFEKWISGIFLQTRLNSRGKG